MQISELDLQAATAMNRRSLSENAHMVYVTLSDGQCFTLVERNEHDELFLEVSVDHRMFLRPRASNSVYITGEL